jgi:hypothetical protein
MIKIVLRQNLFHTETLQVDKLIALEPNNFQRCMRAA